ncbi:hypothetical protein PGB90_009674 [Kerria lacca]
MISKWCSMFEKGRDYVEDETRAGRPPMSHTDANVKRVDNLIREDRRVKIQDIAMQLDISYGTMSTIIHNELKFHKICARWVPRLLNDDHKGQRFEAALTFLQRYEQEGQTFLEKIITVDETWVHHHTPETKRSSMEWKHKDSPRTKKAKTIISARKVMLTVFFDHEGVVYSEFAPKGSTVNSKSYFRTLKNFQKAIKKRRRGKFTEGIILLHDNATPHSARVTGDLLEKFKWEIWRQPPYSPDLLPCDFHLFDLLKNALGGEHFSSDEECKEFVTEWLKKIGGNFYKQGIENLVSRYQKCLNILGDYIEK